MNRLRHDEFYLVWESSCRNFIDDVQFSSHYAKASRLRLHIFLRKDTPMKAMPPKDIWIENHNSLTTSPYSSEMALTSYILEKYQPVSSYLNNQDVPKTVYLVSERERQYEELIAILKLRSSEVDFREVDGREKDIFDVVRDSCRFCKVIFSNEEETKEHYYALHNFFCDNTSCYGYQQQFCSEQSLSRHKAAHRKFLYYEEAFCSEERQIPHLIEDHKFDNGCLQTGNKTTPLKQGTVVESAMKIACQFCPGKLFSSLDKKEIHMKYSHKKCNCSCGGYFKTREEYLDHFYNVYPLPCYENRKCPHRFRSVRLQAAHHRQFHNSPRPFYCVPCQKRKAEERGATQARKTSFKDENGLRIHGFSTGHNEAEMFLWDLMEITSPNRPAGQERTSTRTCSNVNYC